MNTRLAEELEIADKGVSFKSFIFLSLALSAGTMAAVRFLPVLIPDLATSIVGEEAKVFWFLSRGSALVSFALLWLSMAFGLSISNQMARTWPGGAAAVGLHEYTSIAGLGFGIFHALILMGDRYINYSLFEVLVPFASQNYRPVWVGLGQIAFYIWGLLVLSFYVRKKIGTRTWRLIHYASFISYLMVLIHGITSGTDTSTVWGPWIYWISGASLLFLLAYRILFKLDFAQLVR
jgi:predicted ferric reductase